MNASAFPPTLKAWRQSRRLSQLELSLSACVSQRHLSCLESGKAQPSRQMVLLLADALALPLRSRNELLLSAGYAPVFAEPLLAAATMAPIRAALSCMLDQHAPFPALVVDRDWQLLQHNTGVDCLLNACQLSPDNLARLADAEGRLNTLRLTLHPDGLRPHIENIVEVEHHLMRRSQLECRSTGRTRARDIVSEWIAESDCVTTTPDPLLPVMPLILNLTGQRLTLFTTLTTFGTPQDITTDELRVECLYPMDEPTRAWFKSAAV